MPRSSYKHFHNFGASVDVVFATTRTLDFTWVFDRSHHADLATGGLLYDLRFYGSKLHAFVVMATHFHFVSRIPEGRTGPWLLNRLKSASARRLLPHLEPEILEKLEVQDGLNRHHLWAESYRSIVLNTPGLFTQKIGYTHGNPVRASICDQQADFKWSSARYFAEGKWTPEGGLPITDEMIQEFWDPGDLKLK